MNIENIVNSQEYDFIHTNPHLNGKIIFLTFGGSHAYGTNIEGSDVDIRGCAMNSAADLLGLSGFDQVQDNATDTTIFSFNKLVNLICSCNPNTIEMLGCKPEHYCMVSDIGRAFLDNKKMFLSKRAVHSFGGYANQQLRRLQNALARDSYPQTEKERHILGSVKSAMMDFENRYAMFGEGAIKPYIDVSEHEDLETEIFVDVTLKHYPLRDYKNIWSDMNNIVKDYGKLNKRNNKKDDEHLNKHAMHLVRLYLMCLDILEKGEINTYREHDRDYLLEIRAGKYQKPDGTFYMEFFDLIDEYERKLEYAKNNTSLPEKPNFHEIEEFVMSVNRMATNN